MNYINFVYFFEGLLVLTFCFVILNYVFIRDRSYLYYSGYIVCWIFYFGLNLVVGSENETLLSWKQISVPMLGYLFYFRFVIQFLDLKNLLPVIHRIFRVTMWMLAAYILIDTVMVLDGGKAFYRTVLHDVVRTYLISLSIVAITAAAIKRKPLANYLALGTFLLVVGGIIAMYMSNTMNGTDGNRFINIPLFYMQLGIIFQILFFTFAIAYNTRNIQFDRLRVREMLAEEIRQKEVDRLKQQLEKQKIVDEERQRIAADIHDEIGSGLSTIRFISEFTAEEKPNTFNEFKKISELTDKLIDNMRGIVWALSTDQQSIEDLLYYVNSYATDYLRINRIEMNSVIPEKIPEVMLSAYQKRNLFLAVKEGLHNVVKHSDAKFVNIEFLINERFTITIKDNGKGIGEKIRKGNGLRNMKSRMEKIDGIFQVSSDKGTLVSFSIPV
jgi:signal transduction histidine kinase